MNGAEARAAAVVVGAGPAGVRAAVELARAGVRPVLIDEAQRIGGQVYRQGAAAQQRSLRQRYGFEAGKASALFAAFEAARAQIDYRPQTLVWHLEDRALHLVQDQRCTRLPYERLILATGAAECVLPFDGWTLPGVVTLGAAQIALKAHAALVGPRVVLAGSGPLLYLVAWQYVRAGGKVLAVLDAAPQGLRRDWMGFLARPTVAAKGAWLVAGLRLAQVPLHQGATLVGALGQERTEGVQWRDARGTLHTLACDALACGHGLRSESQLADLAGCAFQFDTTDQAWVPRTEAAGRTSVAGVYLAGDGARILGADAAECAGTRAALALLADAGHAMTAADAARARGLERELQRHQRFRMALEARWPELPDWAQTLPDHVVVCRCEEVTAGELRACATLTGTQELNRLKALSRVGMGRCQGRMCGAAAARLLAAASDQALSEVGRLRAQPPVKPVPVQVLACGLTDLPVPPGERDD